MLSNILKNDLSILEDAKWLLKSHQRNFHKLGIGLGKFGKINQMTMLIPIAECIAECITNYCQSGCGKNRIFIYETTLM